MTLTVFDEQPIIAPPGLLKKLHKMGLYTLFDLIIHRPLRYENETHIHTIDQALIGQTLLIEGVIERNEVHFLPRRQLIVRLSDKTGILILRFIHFYSTLQQLLAIGKTIRILGEIRHGFMGKEIIHPKLRPITPLSKTLTPIYPTIKGLSQTTLQRLINEALNTLTLKDTLPLALRQTLKLIPFREAIESIHHPQLTQPFISQNDALKRLKFDELLSQQLLGALARQKRAHKNTFAMQRNLQLRHQLLSYLPFELTRAQQQVLLDIENDLATTKPMHRLLQGDVGSGKTIVAALSALMVIENGFQVAMMVPTEILAEQHYIKFQEWFDPLMIHTLCVTSRLAKTQKIQAIEAIASGKTQFVIGTHALFQKTITFAKLGFIIIDEQHRFGVMQRLALKNKGNKIHQLMMSATPIPRTLAMNFFADIDVSFISELPPNRLPIRTQLIDNTRHNEVEALIKAACQAGQQAYWVCPLIDESEILSLKTVNETYQRLIVSLAPLQVGLLHGKMTPQQKKATMSNFVKNHIQVLVSTTIIEVGIDVVNANLMVIDHAERMGLAQLHQLRGRIGRGSRQGRCLLLFQKPLTDAAKARLKIIYEEQDGFKIAQEDLKIRGPGELLGEQQSGTQFFHFADFVKDKALLQQAKQEAPYLLQKQPKSAKAHIKRWSLGKTQLLEV